MADINEKIKFDDSEIIKGLTNQLNLATKIDKALRNVETSYEEAFVVATKQLDESNKAVETGTRKIGEHISATGQAKQSTSAWADSLKNLAGHINIAGVNLGGFIQNLQAKQAAMKGAVQGLNGMVGGLKALKVAIISTGIGALVVALAAIVSVMGNAEKASDDWARAMGGVSSAGNFLKQRLVNVADSIVKLVKLDFTGSVNSWRDAIGGFTKGLGDAVDMGLFLAEQLDEINDLQREALVTDAKSKGLVADLLLQAADRNKSLEERIRLLKEVQGIEESAAQREFEIKRGLFLNEQLRLKLKGQLATEEEKNNLAALQAAAELAKANRSAVKTAEERKISGFIQQEQELATAAYLKRQAEIKAINDALEEQVNKIIDLADQLHNEKLDPESRARAEANAATLQINEIFRVLEARAKTAGLEIDLEQDKADLLLAIQQKLNRDIENARNEGIPKLGETIIKPLKKVEREALDIVGNVRGALVEMGKNVVPPENFLDAFKLKLQKLFNVDEAGLEQMGADFLAIFDSITAGTGAAIEANAALIDSLKEQEQEADDALERELERQELGLANNVEGERKRIEAIKKEREQAEKEAEKLRKKQIAAQLIADGIAQGSNIVTMVSNVLASPGVSLLGPAGIPIALAVIAAFLSIMSKIKSSQKKLSGGGDIAQSGTTGFVNRQGRTDRDGSRGHRVEDSNVVLGGKEFVVAEGPANEHSKFLSDLNSGKFAGMDLAKEIAARGLHFVIGNNKEHDHAEAIIQAALSQRNDNRFVQAIDQSVGKHIGKLAAALKGKQTVYSYTPGQIVVKEDEYGNKQIIETARPWQWVP